MVSGSSCCRNTVWNCMEFMAQYESVTVLRKTVWQMPERGYTRSSVWDVFLYSFWQGHFIMHRMNHFVTHT